MERLTINEIIEHCNRKVVSIESCFGRSQLESKPMDCNHVIMNPYWEHRQVAKYLEELKTYKDMKTQMNKIAEIIVKRLEEERFVSQTCRSEILDDENICMYNVYHGEIRAYNRAIEIVEEELSKINNL